MKLKSATQQDVERIQEAYQLVKRAATLLRVAGATKASARVRGIVHSVEGAQRHARRRASAAQNV